MEEAWLSGARPGDRLVLLHDGSVVANPANPGTADSLGSLIIRDLTPGSGYAWLDRTTGRRTPGFEVLAPGANPKADSSLYTDQPMHEGLNYITMRDGIELAATVRYPYGQSCSAATPMSDRHGVFGLQHGGTDRSHCALLASSVGAPCTNCGNSNLLPDSATDVGAVVARVSGFATVSLQMRGTGCSGGAFDLFGYPSDYDAYDAIEIVAHQAWVAHHKVGLVGISFSGLSQFPAAGTDPPGLAAITPMSPTDDLFSTGYPGGIYNNGFAAEWIDSRIDDAKPAAVADVQASWRRAPRPPSPGVAQPWTYYEIDGELAAATACPRPAWPTRHFTDSRNSSDRTGGCELVAPGTRFGSRPLAVRPAVHGRLGSARTSSRLLVRRPCKTSKRVRSRHALLDAIPKTTPVFANHGQRRPYRLAGSADHQPMARVPRPLCGRQGPVAAARRSTPLVLDKFVAEAASVPAEAPLPPSASPTNPAWRRHARTSPRRRPGYGCCSTVAPARPAPAPSSPPTAATSPAGHRRVRSPPCISAPAARSASQGGNGAVGESFSLNPAVRPRTSLPAGANVWGADPGWDWTPVPAADGIAFQTSPFTVPTTIVGPATLEPVVEGTGTRRGPPGHHHRSPSR